MDKDCYYLVLPWVVVTEVLQKYKTWEGESWCQIVVLSGSISRSGIQDLVKVVEYQERLSHESD